jgi:sarcosine oxidase subunit alpha
MTSYRLPNRGRVDHNKPVCFAFDGRSYQGLAGDTLASALLANGVHLMGRSFKYHRPRGVVSAGSDEPNALMGTRRGPGRFEPNTRATIQELRDGLEATSQNRWPSLSMDLGSINDRLGSLFSAGFYYKTFMWPRTLWDRVYEPVIRKAAGLGVSPTEPDADRYASRFGHTDVLVIGAGPTGLAAARSAGLSGASVMLVDEAAEPGGSLLSEPSVRIGGKPAWEWLASTFAELLALPNVTVMTRTTAIGYYHQNLVGLAQRLTDHLAAPPEGAPRERLWRVRAREVVLAQGALEKPLVFDGNDRPGVMLAGAAQTYLNCYGVKVGDCPAIVTAHDSVWFAAFDLSESGAKPAVILDFRASVDPAFIDRARALGIETMLGRTVTGTSGRLRVKSVRVNEVENGKAGAARDIACTAILMCGGWTPCLHLFSHTKGSLIWDNKLQTFLAGKKTEAVHIAGAARGLWGIAVALNDGASAGSAAALAAGRNATSQTYAVEADRAGSGISVKELPTDRNPATAKTFIDFQNDVTAKDIRLAVREGMRSIEHVKRYTTNGMATDQGKMSNINGLMIVANALGREPPQVGLTTFRPPYTPTTFGAFAGYHQDATFEVTRKTPVDPWAEAQGAVFEQVALPRRARYFAEARRRHARRGRSRVSRGARICRDFRRLDAWQDRGCRP